MNYISVIGAVKIDSFSDVNKLAKELEEIIGDTVFVNANNTDSSSAVSGGYVLSLCSCRKRNSVEEVCGKVHLFLEHLKNSGDSLQAYVMRVADVENNAGSPIIITGGDNG